MITTLRVRGRRINFLVGRFPVPVERMPVGFFSRAVDQQECSQSIELEMQPLKSLEASVDIAAKLFQAARVEYIDVLFAQRELMEDEEPFCAPEVFACRSLN